MTTSLTQTRLREVLRYDRSTGSFTAIGGTRGGVVRGSDLGSRSTRGYLVIRVDGRLYRAQRLAFLYVMGYWPLRLIDHINRDTFDNRWCNLRESTNAENQYNATRRSDNTSGMKGVTYHTQSKKWRVRVCVNSDRYSFGLFDCLELAGFVAEEARNKYHKKFSRSV